MLSNFKHKAQDRSLSVFFFWGGGGGGGGLGEWTDSSSNEKVMELECPT